MAEYVIEPRRQGLSYAQICTVLNAEQITTPLGSSTWQKSHVDRLLHARWVQDIIEEMGV